MLGSNKCAQNLYNVFSNLYLTKWAQHREDLDLPLDSHYLFTLDSNNMFFGISDSIYVATVNGVCRGLTIKADVEMSLFDFICNKEFHFAYPILYPDNTVTIVDILMESPDRVVCIELGLLKDIMDYYDKKELRR